MPPVTQEQFALLAKQVADLRDLITKNEFEARKTFVKDVRFTARVAFNGLEPIATQSGQSYPSGGTTVDSQARIAINTIIDVLRNVGITL